jgi:hypothetical protein
MGNGQGAQWPDSSHRGQRRRCPVIYKFKSKAAGDVIMLGPNGDHVLRLIGKEPAAKGIIEPAAMLAAMSAIEQAIAAEDAARQGATEQQRVDAPHDRVSLRQRAWPLVELMKRAHAANQEIVWGV